ncbi:hypothetical protein [Rhodococcus sp. MALMAid1271]|uniref:4'-phosphopantetheinyl transferase family protein n=1 Tax=Rhodococcus sp. MALMAid1271 TaxID=3411744 RepID=UPI003BA0609E
MSTPDAIDLISTRRRSLPRDRAGYPVRLHGKGLIAAAVQCRDGVAPDRRSIRTDALRRWTVADRGLHASVAHCAADAVVALHPSAPVGVDLQDCRPRPLALAWLGELVALPGPCTIAQFAECEALIKASHLTKETFRGVRLPDPAPGWRPIHAGYWVHTAVQPDGSAVAVVTTEPMPLRYSTAEDSNVLKEAA